MVVVMMSYPAYELPVDAVQKQPAGMKGSVQSLVAATEAAL